MQTEMFPSTLPKAALMNWEPTRAAGLKRLAAFTPSAGSTYARTRNTDMGPANRANVSALSPWLARRMITEQEVLEAVLKHHSFTAAEKFIQEVFWRTYWKGWLELRPGVLSAFNRDRLGLRGLIENDLALNKRLQAATTGQTGIDCFDAWVVELHSLGWLHNHARMWFASIWIFTLGLPWQLGADFFYKHLLDADAASNTLSWRWVAGLHTKGKHYLARASNIANHTQGRFDPFGQLNETALPLSEDYQVPGPMMLPKSGEVRSDRVGLLLTQEDLHPASLGIGAQVVAAATFSLQSIGPTDSPRNRFSQGAMADAAQRASVDFGVDVATLTTADEIATWAKRFGLDEIVTPYAPTGLVSWELRSIETVLASNSISLTRVRRHWDSMTWPLATGGFFKLKEKLPRLVQELSRA